MRAGLGVTAAITAGENDVAALVRLSGDCAIAAVKALGVSDDDDCECDNIENGFADGGGICRCMSVGL